MAKQDKEPDADDRPGYNGPKTDSIPIVKKKSAAAKKEDAKDGGKDDDMENANGQRYQQGQQKHNTGNRVYNGTSNSPHSGGGLNKSGFANRDKEAAVKKQFLLNQLRNGGF